jgi:hypothetical protein
MRRPRSGRGATAASGPGVRMTPEARSLAACSGVLRCAVSKCPPLASVESADAAWRPAGAHETHGSPSGSPLRTSLSAHFLPFDGPVSRAAGHDLISTAVSWFDGSWPIDGVVRGPGKRCETVTNALRRWQIAEVTGGLSGFRGAGGGRGSRRMQRAAPAAGLAAPAGRRVRPALARTPMACHPRDLPVPLTSERHRAGSFLDNDVGRVGFGSHGNR